MNMPSTQQHAPSTDDPYGFSARTLKQLDHAAQLCTSQGGRMTAQRRDVLGLILSSNAPVGAYDLLEQLRISDRRPAPPTVYRALDFLLEHGLIHRIERLSAFVPCTHLLHEAHDSHTHDTAEPCLHTAQFLICRGCGGVTEIADTPTILNMLRSLCAEKGFTMHSASVEVEGLCATCTATAAASPPAIP